MRRENVILKQNFNIMNNIFNQSKSRERESAKSQGFYDGRFRTKIVKDRRKELSRNWARGKEDTW